MKILAILSIALLTFTTTALSAPKKLTCTEKETFPNSPIMYVQTISFFVDTDDFRKETPIADVILVKESVYGDPDAEENQPNEVVGKKFQLPYKVTPTLLILTYNLYYSEHGRDFNRKTLKIDRKTLSIKIKEEHTSVNVKCSIENLSTSNYII